MSLEETRAIALDLKAKAKAEVKKARRQVELIKLHKESLKEAILQYYGRCK